MDKLTVEFRKCRSPKFIFSVSSARRNFAPIQSYIVVPGEYTWQFAKEYCTNQGAKLLEVRNFQDYNQALGFLYMPGFGWSMWLGGSDASVEGEFKWGNGDAVNMRDFWGSYRGSQQPDSLLRDEDCMSMFNNGFHDSGCEGLKSFVCDKYSH